jgi:hypothetical protein
VLTCWSAECLPSRFGASIWQHSNPLAFCVMWHWEVFLWVGVQGIKVLILLAALFLQIVAPASQWGFGVLELTLSASVP